MGKRRTDQEWLTLIEQSESSSLSTLAFCKLTEHRYHQFQRIRPMIPRGVLVLM
jgi:hypothetical protein